MRANVHKEFSERFSIKVVEVFGATEGNCLLMNLEGKYGACGFIPHIGRLIPLLPYAIIKIDKDLNPIRDENGFCIKCEPDESGIIVGIIAKSINMAYNGYANQKEASEKKIIKNLFKPGQDAFNTGDILKTDWYGYTYFVDRTGKLEHHITSKTIKFQRFIMFDLFKGIHLNGEAKTCPQ